MSRGVLWTTPDGSRLISSDAGWITSGGEVRLRAVVNNVRDFDGRYIHLRDEEGYPMTLERIGDVPRLEIYRAKGRYHVAEYRGIA